MNWTEISGFVRAVADTDIEDAPDEVLYVYARSAYNDIKRRVPTWPHLRATATLTTVASQADYDLNGAQFDTELEFVESVIGDTQKVMYADRDTLQMWNEGIGVDHETNEADYWNEQSGVLTLYPVPASVATYTLRGFRPFSTFPNGNAEPDLPEEFHESICFYVLAMFYRAQEDLELAERWTRDYELSVNRHLAAMMRSSVSTARPQIFGGSRSRVPSYSAWVRRNTEG